MLILDDPVERELLIQPSLLVIQLEHLFCSFELRWRYLELSLDESEDKGGFADGGFAQKHELELNDLVCSWSRGRHFCYSFGALVSAFELLNLKQSEKAFVKNETTTVKVERGHLGPKKSQIEAT